VASNRVLVGQIVLDERFVNNHRSLRASRVLRIELAAFAEWDPKRAKVTGRDGLAARESELAAARMISFHLDWSTKAGVAVRSVVAGRHAGHARYHAQPLQQIVIKRGGCG